ncbi:YHYH protein [Vannielia litorea]|uniref:YHYH protein n=1 Tax=Vannielia litorea TaxID=1217970 RepID=UPI001BCDFDAE|nr:YHYH protein [Vannielia litorea]MBS8227796.1 YHYH protein [Vannielia litorea]
MKVIFTIAALALASPATAHSNKVSMEKRGDQLCFTSNGSPNHSIGSFPNRGNPHSFRAQTVRLCVDATPKDSGRITTAPTSGVTLTGIPIRPGTADYYDRSSPRGHSRDRSSGWNLEGMGAADMLGMDKAFAHVDERGLYHYHGVTKNGVLKASSGTLIGYAADGFEIHYGGKGARSSWRLKSGTRPSGPGGRYDGTYVEDWEFVPGSGNLDQCNGGKVNGRYVYFATQTFPFFPRCFRGTVSADFKGRG